MELVAVGRARSAKLPGPADRTESQAPGNSLRRDVVGIRAVEQAPARWPHDTGPRGRDGCSVPASANVPVGPDTALGAARRDRPGRVADRHCTLAVERDRPRAQATVEKLVPFDGVPVAGVGVAEGAAVTDVRALDANLR